MYIHINSESFKWNSFKSERLKKTRGVSFEEISKARLVDIKDHPSRERHFIKAEGTLKYLGRKELMMRAMKLTKQERAIEEALLRGEYVSVDKKEFLEIKRALDARKKDAVLNIRIRKYDLDSLKKKAAQLGIRYQTFISEILHRVAQAS
jgi:predicted DNA binding CopG/RHH family protein